MTGSDLGRLPVLILVEPSRDQIGQRLDGRDGVGPARLQIEKGAALGGQGSSDSSMTLAVEFIAVVMHPDLGLELQRQLDELLGGPHVQAEAVRDLDLATGDRRFVAHRRLDRPGPGTSDHRVGSSDRRRRRPGSSSGSPTGRRTAASAGSTATLVRRPVDPRPSAGPAIAATPVAQGDPWSASSRTSITFSRVRACRKKPTNRSSFRCREIFSRALRWSPG